ncbi:50S ribosomal protein L3 [Candidatus Woesearchaeota archaeon]|nr:50S ribosomal protein L3 [Candidatus Woesearchaeota archaeon]
MSKYSKPRKGSMQVWPRSRAKKSYARIRNWVDNNTNLKLLGFIGYKVGMTQAMVKDNTVNSMTKGKNIAVPITIIECPSLSVLSLRFYKQHFDGLKLISEVFSKNVDKELKRKVMTGKKNTAIPKEFDEVRIVVYTKPKLTGVGRKKPEVSEMKVGGKDLEEKTAFLNSLLDKEIKINDVFKEGQLLDLHGVTKGKGFQGPIKRFGVGRVAHKSKKKVRGIGSVGPWHPSRVRSTVAQPGKMGFHQRTEYNKLLLKIGNNPKEIENAGGFRQYGVVKNNYVLVSGSVVGTYKRPVIMTEAVRPKKRVQSFELVSLGLNIKK